MTGYADLGGYGDWRGSPQYGAVWYPSQVPADWAPYRDGRWIWVAPWGGGLGSTNSRGALRHFIMGGGPISTIAGAGSRANMSRSRSMRRHSSPLSALALPKSAPQRSQAGQWVGFPSRRARCIGRAIPVTRPTSATSTSPMSKTSILRSSNRTTGHRRRRSSTPTLPTTALRPLCRSASLPAPIW